MEQKIGFKHHTVKVSCPARMKTAMKLLICANNFLLPTGLATVIAITVTFCNRGCHQEKKIPYRPLENTNIIHHRKIFSVKIIFKKRVQLRSRSITDKKPKEQDPDKDDQYQTLELPEHLCYLLHAQVEHHTNHYIID